MKLHLASAIGAATMAVSGAAQVVVAVCSVVDGLVDEWAGRA